MALAQDEKTIAPDEKRLTRCLRLEVIKPLGDHTWETIGPHLHDLRYAVAHLLNEGTVACLVSDKAPQSAARDGIVAGLKELRSFHAKRVKSIGRGEEGDQAARRAKSARLASLELPSAMIDAMTGQIKARFGKWRKQRFVGHERFPSFTSDTLMVRDTGWRLEHDGKGYVLSVKLHAGLTDRVRFALRADGGNAHAQARLIATGATGVKQGDCKLVWDDGDRKWSVRLAYSRPLEEAPARDPARVLSVHRGIRAFLTWADSDGNTSVIHAAAGQDIANFKRQMTRRRTGMRRHMAGSPRHRGRGWWRKFDNYRKLEDVEARFTDAKCKQAAAEIRRLVEKNGYGTVLLDDWNARQLAAVVAKFEGPYAAWLVRRFPFAQMHSAIKCALEPLGTNVIAAPAAYESIECPSCHNIDATQDDGRGGFKCKKCEFRRTTDCVANLNALARAGVEGVLDRQNEKTVAPLKAARERSGAAASNGAQKKEGARKPARNEAR